MLIRASGVVGRPYAPMTTDDVAAIRAAGRRVAALDFIAKRAAINGGKVTAASAQRMARELRAEIYQKFDVRL